MDAKSITVVLRADVPGDPQESETYTAHEGYTLRALIGKHIDLRILEVKILDDVNIETGKIIEEIEYIEIHAPDTWTSYRNNKWEATE